MRFFLPELIYYTCYYFLFTDRCRKMRYKQGNSFPYVIFSWCQMRQNFFDLLLSTDIVYCFKYNVILCQLFFQQTGAVKTLPPHNSISFILSFFFTDSNEFPIQFVCTNQISFLSSNKEHLTNNIFTLQFDLDNKIVIVI